MIESAHSDERITPQAGPPTMPTIRWLQMSRYKSTADADRTLSRLSQASGWQDHVISRLAISRSLQDPSPPEAVGRERKGKELRGETLFHSKRDSAYLPWVAAMIAQHAGRPFTNDDEAVEWVLAHWHRGLELLRQDLEKHAGDFNRLLLDLAREAASSLTDVTGRETSDRARSPQRPLPGSIRPITVPIGRVAPDAEPITITLNDTKRYSNSHVAVSGMSGSGKTQLVKQMLASAAEACDTSTGIIFIDFAKGDVAADSRFVSAIGAEVLRLPGDILPIGPFHLPDYSDDSIRLAAEEKREVYSQLFRELGPKQQGRLAEAIRGSYEALRNAEDPAPDFAYLQHRLNDVYEHDGLQPDSLSELLRRLNAYRLFWTRGSEPPSRSFHTKRWIVDIHELGGLKQVTAFTLIEQLYREMRSLDDSAVDSQNGLRQVRCILVIDEAQYYLAAKNRFLQGIIREGRSKGFAVMLLCQSPDDFDQPDFDYTEQLQFTFMLQCKTEPKAVQRLLGGSRDEATRLATELGRMEPLYGIGRLPGQGGTALTRFRIVPFFENFS